MSKDPYEERRMSAEQALAPLRSGQHVFVGSAAGEPQRLTQALRDRCRELSDVESLQLASAGGRPADDPPADRLRHTRLFIRPEERAAVAGGLADYSPAALSSVPGLIRSGRIPVDAALIQVTPPEAGFCSLGVSVDIARAAIDAAAYVVAQVNPRMPWSEGDSRILVEDIDAFVVSDLPLPEYKEPDLTAAALWIARYVSELVADGATIQVGAGAVPTAVLAALSRKRDLGLHAELLTDAMLRLIEAGAATGRRKCLHREKAVASMCLGGRRLYEAVHRNSAFEFHPSDYVNDPDIIARHDGFTAINSALAVDLTGQAAADSLGGGVLAGIGGLSDFVRGAGRARRGRSIIALPSTAKNGAVSRLVPALPEGSGVSVTRADADFVVTEYGLASLKGKSLRERAVALIGISHPSYRRRLIEEAERLGLLDAGHIFPAEAAPYLVELEATRRFSRDELFFRPLKPSDERHLKDLFYSQSQRTTIMRFGIPLKRLREEEFQRLVAIDFRNSMAIGVFLESEKGSRLVGVGRYAGGDAVSAEAAITVHDDFQGQGVGRFLLDYLAWIGRRRGVRGFHAELLALDDRMRRLLAERFRRVEIDDLGEDGVAVSVRLADWKGQENPAREAAAARL